jgi:hypothetical protein
MNSHLVFHTEIFILSAQPFNGCVALLEFNFEFVKIGVKLIIFVLEVEKLLCGMSISLASCQSFGIVSPSIILGYHSFVKFG